MLISTFLQTPRISLSLSFIPFSLSRSGNFPPLKTAFAFGSRFQADSGRAQHPLSLLRLIILLIAQVFFSNSNFVPFFLFRRGIMGYITIRPVGKCAAREDAEDSGRGFFWSGSSSRRDETFSEVMPRWPSCSANVLRSESSNSSPPIGKPLLSLKRKWKIRTRRRRRGFIYTRCEFRNQRRRQLFSRAFYGPASFRSVTPRSSAAATDGSRIPARQCESSSFHILFSRANPGK